MKIKKKPKMVQAWWVIHRDCGTDARVQGPIEVTEDVFKYDTRPHGIYYGNFEDAHAAVIRELIEDVDNLNKWLTWTLEQKKSWGKHDGPS